ncbi:expressed unknown protein [Seminavis robusta]|uniref:Uncharacterized protein n=1 Tax=Seminavis robusta TaxID=568900 RepID=A0A9N8EVS8_9STRA|nr:expressed unknown protein [Seminavis robusta]|eukprot:Sro1755_g295540.1 n/a (555) ;mRNA; r:12529-14193
MGQCQCSVPSVEEEESARQFRALFPQNNLVGRFEMKDFVASRAELWAMLSVNLNLSESVCQVTATRVAMELTSGLEGDAALNAEITEAQFHAFRCRYMLDGKGAQEFFHRCVFASFDADCSHCLDAAELDTFLDTFYGSGSIFQGDARLPPKEELKQRILSNSNGGDQLTFEEIRDVLRGNTTKKNTTTTTNSSTPSTSTVDPNNNNNNNSKHPTTQSLHDTNIINDKTNKEPEETPETPGDLAPPSKEMSAKDKDEPEQTPEVQPFEATFETTFETNFETMTTDDNNNNKPPSPTQPRKPRQRKSVKGDRGKSRSRSPSARTPRRTQSGRSTSPSARKRTGNKSRSPSARTRRTSSRPTASGSSEELSNRSGHGGKSKSPSSSRGLGSSEEQLSNRSGHGGKSKSPSSSRGLGSSEEQLSNRSGHGGKSKSPSSSRGRKSVGGNSEEQLSNKSGHGGKSKSPSATGRRSMRPIPTSGSEERKAGRSRSPSSRTRKSIRASKSFDESHVSMSSGGTRQGKPKRRHSTNQAKRNASKSPKRPATETTTKSSPERQ